MTILLLLRCVLYGAAEYAEDMNEALSAVQYSTKMAKDLQESQAAEALPPKNDEHDGDEKDNQVTKKNEKKNPSQKIAKLQNRGCPLMCVNSDLVKSAILPGDGNNSWECARIENYVRHDAAKEDCLQLVDHFAPLCCKSQLGHAPYNVKECADCSGGCIVQNACFHSFGGYGVKQKRCIQHHGKWCGPTSVDDRDTDKSGQGALLEEDVDEDEDDDDDGPLDQGVPPSTDDGAALVQGNEADEDQWNFNFNLPDFNSANTYRRRRLFRSTTSGNCQFGEFWMSSNSYVNDQGALKYYRNEKCRFTITRPVAMQLVAFETEEGFDFLSIQGKKYSGNMDDVRPNITKLSTYLGPGDTIEWTSDGSVERKGWKMEVSPFEKLGKGRCSNGHVILPHYKSFLSKSLEHSFDMCLGDENCLYLAYEKPPHHTIFYGASTKMCRLSIVHPDEVVWRKVEKKWPCCTGGNFVHTNDDCSDNKMTMKVTGAEGVNYVNVRGDSVWKTSSSPEGTKELAWKCYDRRRRGADIFGVHYLPGTWESTSFSPPNNLARIRIQDGQIDFWPKYCPPPSVNVPTSPLDRKCCSIADGTLDSCNSQNFIQMKVGEQWKKCYKGQICEWIFDEPQSQGIRVDWYCGNTKEGVKWGLYFDTLQVKFRCDGTIEWNPWWCGLHTGGQDPPSVMTALADALGRQSDFQLTPEQLETSLGNFVNHNKQDICESMAEGAVYQELLKPSGVCWRSGHEGRSSLFHHHSDFGTKTSLLEHGTAFQRSERKHSSPWLQVLDMLERNATLLKVAASANEDAVSRRELEMVVQQVKLTTGGTDCNLINKVECGWYCTASTLDCVEITMEKINAVIQFVAELALDIVLAVTTGGAGNAALKGAKAARAAAMATLKAAARKAKSAGWRAVGRHTAKAIMDKVKKNVLSFVDTVGGEKFAKRSIERIRKDLDDVARKNNPVDRTWDELDTIGRGITDEVKEHMTEAVAKSVATLGCETIIEETMDEAKEDPDWVNNQEYRWGNMEDFGGFLEVMDITGIVSLVGAFHESDCPAVWPGNAPKASCPR